MNEIITVGAGPMFKTFRLINKDADVKTFITSEGNRKLLNGNLPACCVTGHRHIHSNQKSYTRQRLTEAVEASISDGYRVFISGYAKGIDLIFANIIAEQKVNHDIYLAAAIPYSSRLKCSDWAVQLTLVKADVILVCSEKCSASCYMKRNLFMLDNSERLIAVYDGRSKGGTYNTLKKAQKQNKEIILIAI